MKNRILILDDDKNLLDVLQEALTYGQYEVRVTEDSYSFFKLFIEFKPDLVILDYILKESNGGEVCHVIKSREISQPVPVIIMSAYSRVFQSLGNYGSDSFIAKPFDLSTLLNCIKSNLKIKSGFQVSG